MQHLGLFVSGLGLLSMCQSVWKRACQVVWRRPYILSIVDWPLACAVKVAAARLHTPTEAVMSVRMTVALVLLKVLQVPSD